ncbi:hypothetical protein GCM10027258_33550 [Amycolatopsis stemonae]
MPAAVRTAPTAAPIAPGCSSPAVVATVAPFTGTAMIAQSVSAAEHPVVGNYPTPRFREKIRAILTVIFSAYRGTSAHQTFTFPREQID